MTENEIFEGIHKDCGSLEICNYKETGCGDCIIRQTLINAEKALEEIQQYRAIGTVKECRVAVERMKPKKPFFNGANYECPNCHTRPYADDAEDKKPMLCDICGQILDWQ